MVTFNQINKAFNNIAVAHKQINTYGIGDIWEIATSGDIRYPMMWAKPENGRLETNIYVSSWTLIFMDLVDNGERNENDVLSDQELIALDVVALLKDHEYEFEFDYTGASIERFTERFKDKVAGVLLRIDIRVPFTADRCQVPQSGLVITGGQISPCEGVTITDNGSIVSVESGGSYDCTPQIKSLFLKSIFETGDDEMESITIDADNAGTYTSISDDGASGTITLNINGAGYGSFVNPTALAIGDTLLIKRTTTTGDGWVKLTGTYE